MKKITKTIAKKRAWKAFSLYIRMRDQRCVTCGVSEFLQAGHFIVGRHNSVLFDERNCHAQCYGCNVGRKGNIVEYYPFMVTTYGQNVIDELKLLDKKLVQYKAQDYLDIEEKYKSKLDTGVSTTRHKRRKP